MSEELKGEEKKSDTLDDIPYEDGIEPLSGVNEKEKETPASSSESEQTKEETSQDDNLDKLPLHKNRRFKQLVDERNEWREKALEYERQKSIEEEVKRQVTDSTSRNEVLPVWWQKVYGDTPESKDAFIAYSQETNQTRQVIKNEVLAEIKLEQEKEIKNKAKAQEWFDSQFNELREEGKQIDENKIIAFLNKHQLIDNQGRYDIKGAYELMNEIEEKSDPKNKTRKDLADNAGGDNKPPKPIENFLTPSKIKEGRLHWNSL